MIEATTGSQSFEADTNAGEKYFKLQLNKLCPSKVQQIAKSKPTTTAEISNSQIASFRITAIPSRVSAQETYTI